MLRTVVQPNKRTSRNLQKQIFDRVASRQQKLAPHHTQINSERMFIWWSIIDNIKQYISKPTLREVLA